MKGKGIVNFLQKYMFVIIIVLVGLAYILTGASKIIPTGETLESILSTILLSTILGWLISALFGQQAIIDGYNDPDLISANNSLANQVEKIEQSTDKLDTFCDRDNELTMTRKRTRRLKRVGLTYEQFEKLDKNTSKELLKSQKRAVKKAYKIGYGFLSSDWLLSDIDEKEEKNEKPTNVSKYVAKKNISNLFTKLLTGILSGYYMLEPFVNANWNILIWRAFFFTVWLIFGYVRYITDYNFMTKVYRKTIVSKTNYLVKFELSLINNPEWYITNKKNEPSNTKERSLIVQEEKDKLLTEAKEENIIGESEVLKDRYGY